MSQENGKEIDQQLWEKVFLIRGVEQTLLDLFQSGELFGTVHTCIGQEWSAVAIAECLGDEDLIFSNHRCHGHFLARTNDVTGLIAEVMGKQIGVCGGKGGSQHLCSKGFFSNGIQGGIVPVAAGFALSLKCRSSNGISVVFIGDGTLGEGIVYESMNIAAKWELPLLIVVENNLYSQSTAQKETLAGGILDRANAFGIKNNKADTWHPSELLASTANAVEYIRSHTKPFFLQIDTYRLMAHSKGDDDRDPQELKDYWEKDPLALFSKAQPDQMNEIQKIVADRLKGSVELARQAPYAEAESTTSIELQEVAWEQAQTVTTNRQSVVIRDALERNMERNNQIILIGEDIQSPYGGAFKVSKGLSDAFPKRVLNTPISEATIVGIGNGLALQGWRPVCEIMFGDFLTLACDQLINHSSKFRYMYNGQVSVPLIVRTPMGGRRGYGATHSQSLEKHFLGIPDVIVLSLNSRLDPALIYDRLFSEVTQPVIVTENKSLYAERMSNEMPPGFDLEHSNELFPTVRIKPEGCPDITILCYGGMLPDTEKAMQEAFDEHEIICEVICPSQLYPFNPAPLLGSIEQSGRLVIVEEGIAFAAFGSEAVSQVTERSPGGLKRLKRVSSPEHPIPACGPLEKEVLPHKTTIVNAILECASNE